MNRRSFLGAALRGAAAAMAARIGLGSVAAATPSKKGLVKGLMTRSWVPSVYADVVKAWNPEVDWAAVEPSPGSFQWGPIDSVIQTSKTKGLGMRLRLRAGFGAPQWAKELGGPPVYIEDPVDGKSGTVARWWTPEYIAAYSGLQAALSARFDADPTLNLIFVTGAMTVYAEPFIRQLASPVTRANLLAADYSKEADQDAIASTIAAHAVWAKTNNGLAFNAWQWMDPDGDWGASLEFTRAMMSEIRTVLGPRAVLQNNSIRESYVDAGLALYDEFHDRPKPKHFQTATAAKVGDLYTAVDWAIEYLGSTGVELPSGYGGLITHDQAAVLDSRLKAN